MDSSEAREHIEMVERIIAQSSQRLQAGGEFFVVWGFIVAAIDALVTAAATNLVSSTVFYVAYPLLIAAGVAFSIVRTQYYRRCGDYMSLLQREYLNVLWLTIALATIAMFTMFNLFHTFTAEIALWSFTETIVLFYVGMHGNRRAQVGGIAILASLVVANFVPAYAGWILALGVLIGYAGFGTAELIARE